MLFKKKQFEVQSLVFSFVVITICEVFLMLDVYADFFRLNIDTQWISHQEIELLAVLMLALSMIVIGMQIVRLLKEHRQAQQTIGIASGELFKVIHQYFLNWSLSPSESEIALLLIKGLTTKEIADLRHTKIGTVKSQTSSIYLKSGLKGRNELVAYFIEDLLSNEDTFGVDELSRID